MLLTADAYGAIEHEKIAVTLTGYFENASKHYKLHHNLSLRNYSFIVYFSAMAMCVVVTLLAFIRGRYAYFGAIGLTFVFGKYL